MINPVAEPNDVTIGLRPLLFYLSQRISIFGTSSAGRPIGEIFIGWRGIFRITWFTDLLNQGFSTIADWNADCSGGDVNMTRFL